MGCAASKPTAADVAAPTHGKGISDSMVAGMTMGEIKDSQCPHNARIEAALDAARAEIEQSKSKSVWDDYEADTELIGRGAFARVFKAIRREDQHPVAVKVIGRDTKAFKQQRRAMVTKIATMRTLQDHPNMLQLHHVFEDEEGFHVVVEYCKGAPLLDAIHDKGHFTEAQAAHVMRQLLEFLAYAHDTCNVVHRDIKPENLLLLDPDAPQCVAAAAAGRLAPAAGGDGIESMLLKVIDFGTAGFCEPGQHLHSKVGTARYVAPEVLNQDYDRLSDIWSAGVVLYVLLCGRPPFKGSTETGTIRQVKAGSYKLDDDVWGQVHNSAKDMLSHMMVVEPSQRWTARELLQHPWFDEVSTAPERPLHHVVDRLGAFTGAARMKRLALKLMVAAAASTPGVLQDNKELNRLRTLFQQMDQDGDGIISGQQLRDGLISLDTQLSERDIAEFLQVSKVDCHAEGVNINEFIAAMFDAQQLAYQQQQQLVAREFAELDVDGDGFITAADLVAASRAGIQTDITLKRTVSSPTSPSADDSASAMMHEVVHEALGDELSLAEAAAILDEVDETHQGRLSLAEFTAIVLGPASNGLEDKHAAPAVGAPVAADDTALISG